MAWTTARSERRRLPRSGRSRSCCSACRTRSSGIRRVVDRALTAIAVLALPCALGLDAFFGVDVTFLLSPKDAEARAEWRELRDARDDVAEIYGSPVPGGTRRVLLFRGDDDPRVIVPREDPARRLLVSDGTDVWDVELVFVTGLALTVLAGILAFFLYRRG